MLSEAEVRAWRDQERGRLDSWVDPVSRSASQCIVDVLSRVLGDD